MTSTKVCSCSSFRPDQEVHDLFRGLGVEGAGGLVTPHDSRLVYQRPGNRNPLLLAAAHLLRPLVRLVREPHHLQGALGLSTGGFRLHAGHQERQLYVLDAGEDGDQIVRLEDKTHLLRPETGAFPVRHLAYGVAVYEHFSPIQPVQAGEAVEQSSLAASRRPHDGNHVSPLDPEIHTL